MRLDKYLKVSRIIKRRTVANDACDAGHVKVNGNKAKSSYVVKESDILEISFGQKVIRARIVSIKEHARKEETSEMYEIIE